MMKEEKKEWQEAQEKTSIISFIGTTPNIGTTIAALRHCYHIANYTMCKVLFMCLNFKSSKLPHYFGISSCPTSLDDILPHIKNKQLKQESFQQLLYQPSTKHEVYMLLGNKQRELAEQYLEEDLHLLIQLASEQFDYIIIDSSSYWDTAGSFAALQYATQIVVVTTDARSHFQEDYQRWFGALGVHLSLHLEQLNLLVLRQPFANPHYSFKDIVSETMATPYADTHFPTSLYGYLDRGELLDWLLNSYEGKAWLADCCHVLFNPAHLSQLPNSSNSSTSLAKVYWPWLKRKKEITAIELGG